jgi:hypothetical protein
MPACAAVAATGSDRFVVAGLPSPKCPKVTKRVPGSAAVSAVSARDELRNRETGNEMSCLIE